MNENGSAIATAEDEDSTSSLTLSLREHNITMVIQAGDRIDGGIMTLRGGILIMGAVRATIVCKGGSAVIVKGAEFQGDLTADSIFVEGMITSRNPTAMSKIVARGASPAGILMLSATANVQAHFSSRATQISGGARLNASQFLALHKPAGV